MKLSWHRTFVSLGLAVVSAALPLSQAIASPTMAEHDRSDNLVKFTYDSQEGDKTWESTWTRDGGSDDVLFRVAVLETEDSGSGLLGKLSVRLDGDQAVKYDGWFALRLVDEAGDVTFHRARPSEIVLRPQPGLRRAVVRFRFDVPSGTYTASGAFEV